jgi:permuted papain-like amidase YaeF/Yiix C92 family enzyme
MTIDLSRPKSRRRATLRLTLLALAAFVAAGLSALGWALGPACYAYWSYAPQEGDIIFQSLPHSPLVNSIEGATQSSFSHCGLVAKRDGQWVVYEALRGVSATPLSEFIFRGRGQGFAVYRLKLSHRAHIPATIARAETYLGRPYDVRYRMDDEKIYCSELIYKAYRDASSEELGRLVCLGDLHWKPFEATIVHFEQGPVPLEREMITPRDLALAEQLECVLVYDIATP